MPHKKTRFVRETRRKEAEERQAHYDSLTIEQKLTQIESRPGESKRERARLEAQLAPSNKKE